jgi:hypothetical protein
MKHHDFWFHETVLLSISHERTRIMELSDVSYLTMYMWCSYRQLAITRCISNITATVYTNRAWSGEKFGLSSEEGKP